MGWQQTCRGLKTGSRMRGRSDSLTALQLETDRKKGRAPGACAAWISPLGLVVKWSQGVGSITPTCGIDSLVGLDSFGAIIPAGRARWEMTYSG
jgi:hypothetical protein